MLRFPAWLRRNSGPRRHSRRKGIRLWVEPLEDRTLLAAAATGRTPLECDNERRALHGIFFDDNGRRALALGYHQDKNIF
jgi:hypothetical protein